MSKKCKLGSADLKVLVMKEDGLSLHNYYNATLIKAGVKGWPYGNNNFYKMQIVHDKIKDLYVLINNWGHIDD